MTGALLSARLNYVRTFVRASLALPRGKGIQALAEPIVMHIARRLVRNASADELSELDAKHGFPSWWSRDLVKELRDNVELEPTRPVRHDDVEAATAAAEVPAVVAAATPLAPRHPPRG